MARRKIKLELPKCKPKQLPKNPLERIPLLAPTIFDHPVEFVEHAGDICDDTADYMKTLAE
jgi:hypothetical protein